MTPTQKKALAAIKQVRLSGRSRTSGEAYAQKRAMQETASSLTYRAAELVTIRFNGLNSKAGRDAKA